MIKKILKVNAVNVNNIYSDNELYSSDLISNFYLSKETNSKGFFCDNFSKSHLGNHIVFAGCSVTSGMGLEKNQVWTNILYEKINAKSTCSGYFNIAIPGNSIINQIILLFKYFQQYGNPNIIFMCIPNINRFYFFDKKNNKIHDSFYDPEEKNFIKIFVYQYYFMLDQYCKSNNIKLYSFTWDLNDNGVSSIFTNIFDTFYNVNKKELIEYVFTKRKIKNAIIASDNEHFGTAYHEYWANFMYDKIKDII